MQRFDEDFVQHAPVALKVVDFQFAAQGAGAADIACLLGQGLPTELRSGHDEELLAEYLRYLGDRGVDDYSYEEAWRHYRFAVGYQMALPVVVLLGSATMPERARQLCMTLIERAAATFDEINAAEVFG